MRAFLRLIPIVAILAFGVVSCAETGTTQGGGSGSGCTVPEECGDKTMWDGSKCVAKDKMCGSGTKYNAEKDKCERVATE
ncbi:MAG: hypothetical protein ABIJ96_02600 [Elusimicrobiota bacterium]